MWKVFSAITRNGEWGKIIHIENCGKGGWNPMAILTLYLFTGERIKIAVECKYKEKEYERIFWADENQIERYQDFSAKEKMPVFVIIGIGGRPKNPNRMFLIPLHLIKYHDVKMDYLQKFERDPRKPFSLGTDGNLI